jgi:hypothetical protein
MGRGIFNMAMGAALVGGALFANMTLIGTNSSEALIAVGGAVIAYGAWGVWRARR